MMAYRYKPGQSVLFTAPAGERRATFVRYSKPRIWPPTKNYEKCLIKTIHDKRPFLIDVKNIRLEEL